MKEDIYYIAAKNLLKWTPETRREIVDRLSSPYERECVRQAFVNITNQRHIDALTLDALVKTLIATKRKAVHA